MPSKANELYYRAELAEVVRDLRAWARTVLLPAARAQLPGKVERDEDVPESVENVIVEKQRAFARTAPKAEALSARVVLKNLRTVDERLAASVRASMDISIEPFLLDTPRIRSTMGEKIVENVNLIQSVPGQYFQGVTDAVAHNWKTGTNYETLADAIEKVADTTDTRAMLIARDQTGKISAAFNQIRQTDLGIKLYGWVCTHMNTRPSHLAMESKDVGYGPGVFSWEKPGPLRGTIDGRPCHPGEDIQCHCGAIPHVNLEELVDSLGYGGRRN